MTAALERRYAPVMDIERLLAFLKLTHAFQLTERRLNRPGDDRLENDAEHSFQLALAAWFINDTHKLGLDTDRLIRFALVHDLPEVYAGDTFAFTTDQDERDSKEAREAAATARIASEFPEFPGLTETIHAYERRDTPEAKLVYALDKLLPTANNYVDGGRTWHREGITLAMMSAYKADKIAESPVIAQYYREIVALIERDPKLMPRSAIDPAPDRA